MHLFDSDFANAGNVFLACEDWRKLEVFEMHKYVGPGAQMLFRHKPRKMDTPSLLLPWIGKCSCVVCWKEFFSSVGQGIG